MPPALRRGQEKAGKRGKDAAGGCAVSPPPLSEYLTEYLLSTVDLLVAHATAVSQLVVAPYYSINSTYIIFLYFFHLLYIFGAQTAPFFIIALLSSRRSTSNHHSFQPATRVPIVHCTRQATPTLSLFRFLQSPVPCAARHFLVFFWSFSFFPPFFVPILILFPPIRLPPLDHPLLFFAGSAEPELGSDR